MTGQLETTVLRGIAVLSISTAVIVAIVITVNSGILSGSDQAAEPVDSGQETTAVEASDEEEAVDASEESAGEQSAEEPAEQTYYTVQEGDSFYSIANKYETSIAEIQKLNPNVDPQNLSSGTKLIVP